MSELGDSDSLQLLEQSKVSKAVAAVIASAEKKRKNDVLAEEVENFQVQVCLKKIPQRTKTTKINLPHSITRSDLDVCLFVKDLDKSDRDYEPTVNHFQELFAKKGVTSISEIIPLKSLRLEYQPHEAKRNLSYAYDVFLADERIVKFLPRLLGKHFYNEKKNPVQVNLRASDLTKEINRALNTCRCTISGRGSSSMVTVGNTGMTQADLSGNIIALGEQLASCVPGGLDNIKQLLMKTKSSVSVPFYMSTGGPQDVFIQKEQKQKDDDEAEEVSTVMGAKVKVYRDGRILLIKDGETEQEALKRVRVDHSKKIGTRKRKRPVSKQSAEKKHKKKKSGK